MSVAPGAGQANLRALPGGARPSSAGGWDGVALAIVAAGIVIRFLALGRQSLWYDEIRAVSSVWGRDASSLPQIFFSPRAPMYHLLLRAWIPVFGSGEAQVRLLSALLGSIGLVLFHRVMPRLLGRPAALVALALVALSPFNLWYSQEATSYALFFDMGLLAVPAFLAELERRTPRSFVLALAATAATCLSNPSGFFLLALAGVHVLTLGRRWGYPIRRFMLFALLAAVLLSPWIVGGAGTAGPLHLGRPEANSEVPTAKGDGPPGLPSIPFAFYAFSLGHSVGPNIDELKQHRLAAVLPHLPFLVPAGLLFALIAWRGVRRADREIHRVLAPWVIVPVLLMTGASMLNLKPPNPRYATFAFAPYMAYLAIGVTSVRGAALRRLACAALLSCLGFSDVEYFTNPRYWKPDARSAGRLLTREAGPEDAVVLYTLQYPVSYYVPGTMTLLLPEPKDFTDRASVVRWLDAHTRGKRRVWIVQYHGWWADPDNRFLRTCRETMRPDGEWPFPKVPVYRFTGPPATVPGAPAISPHS